MPVSAESLRQTTGLFTATLVAILSRKARIAANRVKGLRLSNFATKLAATTLLAFLFMSGIEPNPGPGIAATDWSRRTAHEDTSQSVWSDVLSRIWTLTQAVANLEDTQQRMQRAPEQSVVQLSSRLERVEGKQDSEHALSRLDVLEQEMDKLDTTARKNNLKFLGVPELQHEDDRSSVQAIVETLNEHTYDGGWRSSDIRSGRQPRPLIVSFERLEDKLYVLQDRDLRHSLRRASIRATADLTKRQRSQLQFFKEQGRTAYFKNGTLYVDNRRYTASTQGNTMQEHNHSGHSRDADYADRTDYNDHSPASHRNSVNDMRQSRENRQSGADQWRNHNQHEWNLRDNRHKTTREDDYWQHGGWDWGQRNEREDHYPEQQSGHRRQSMDRAQHRARLPTKIKNQHVRTRTRGRSLQT